MDKAHEVQKIAFTGTRMLLRVDGKDYEIDLSKQSEKLAGASAEQRDKYIVSPAGYGIRWPELDEDLSIDGLIGVKHSRQTADAQA